MGFGRMFCFALYHTLNFPTEMRRLCSRKIGHPWGYSTRTHMSARASISPYWDTARDRGPGPGWRAEMSGLCSVLEAVRCVLRGEDPTRRRYRDADARRTPLKRRTGDGVDVERSELTKRQRL